MQARPLERARRILCVAVGLILASAPPAAVADSDGSKSKRLQDLLSGEVLFHAHQKDYFSAITHLQLAHERGLLPQKPADSEVLLTRLKLAYGLHEEARLALPAQLSQKVPETVRNRAWYELAKSLFQKGYPEAAMKTLDRVQGRVPEDILGDHQLLHAHVLLALHRYRDAAKVLEKWKGPEALAGYAYYNRGIALVRVGDYEGAIDSLVRVVSIRAKEEELLALKDKANLTLGYAFLRSDSLDRARTHLQQVRLQSPFSSRALLAVGWIAQEQGRAEDALAPWMELRNRTLADPAVQESLLAVPFVHRELRALRNAAQHYEQAVAALSGELHWLDDAMESLQRARTLNVLLHEKSQSGTGSASREGTAANDPESRYFGPLLASRIFLETSRGHSDLRSMLDRLEKGARNIDRLEKSVRAPSPRKRQRATASRSPRSVRKPTGPAHGPRADGDAARSAAPSRPGWAVEWQGSDRAGRSFRGVPLLPEVELPPERAVKPLPRSEVKSFPQSEVIAFPKSEVISLPKSEIIWLPKSEWIRLPDTGRLRFPKPDYQESPYPDAVARDEHRPRSLRRPMRRFIHPGTGPAFAMDGKPTGKALEELAGAVGRATDRMDRVVRALSPKEARSRELEHRLAALRERILRLRNRVAAAIALHENYAKSLAIDELERRKGQVEHYLEQARLELAKTYDLAAGK